MVKFWLVKFFCLYKFLIETSSFTFKNIIGTLNIFLSKEFVNLDSLKIAQKFQ
jgi:hypothetical protein